MRIAGRVGPSVNVTLDTVMKCKKDEFLSNKENKLCFTHLLDTKLKTDGHAKADARVLIVQSSAVEAATTTSIIFVGDDTNLLVLLCYHANISPHDTTRNR